MASEADDVALRIVGGRPLSGEVEIAGAKNAAMKCLAAALLTDEVSIVERVPDIADVRGFCEMLRALGASAEHDLETGSVRVAGALAEHLDKAAPDNLVREQRASILLVGALLGRGRKHVESAPPGGDDIGARPLDIHFNGFRKLGATVDEASDGRIIATAPQRLRGARLFLDFPSVLATENLMLAAVLAEGRTEIVHAAPEPEVVCMADLLRDMGACISGAGTPTIVIDGVERLHGGRQRLIPDRIEAGTLAIAAAISGGSATLRGVDPAAMVSVIEKLKEAGVSVDAQDDSLTVCAPQSPATLCAVNLHTWHYPGFPTDLQAPITALLTQADGVSVIRERIFEDRAKHADALRELGANVEREGLDLLHVDGPSRLRGAAVRGGDIRAVAALVVAALAAEGESRVSGIHHLDRGYERLEQKLAALGAEITREPARRPPAC